MKEKIELGEEVTGVFEDAVYKVVRNLTLNSTLNLPIRSRILGNGTVTGVQDGVWEALLDLAGVRGTLWDLTVGRG